MFLFRAAHEYPLFGSKLGLLRHRKDKKRTTSSENQAFRAALLLNFWAQSQPILGNERNKY